MLSRRRSSEQAVPQQTLPSSPSLLRLDASLRGVNVLFSTIAQPDTLGPPPPRHDAPQPSTDPSASGSLGLALSPVSSTEQQPARRRLFSRDTRHERARRGQAGAPPLHRLVVVASTKNAAYLRLYQLLDYPSISRVSISRVWNLSDLRKVDGLGLPVAESVRFGLFFTSGKMLIWRTQTPFARASFLWSLLQTCASRLKRAPPVQHLRLLDLQTFVDDAARAAPKADADDDDSSSMNYVPSERSNARHASSLDEMNDFLRAPIAIPHTTASESTKSHPTPTHSAKRVTPDDPQLNNPSLSPSGASALYNDIPVPPKPMRGLDSTQRASNPPARPARAQRVTRTLSEPKVSSSFPKSDDPIQPLTVVPRQPDTIAQPFHITGGNLHDMNIDERAFLAAAKRMGAKHNSPICKEEIIEQFASVGSDPNALKIRNRFAGSDIGGGKLLAERRLQQEMKLFKLAPEEQEDFVFALDLFYTESPDAALADFGTWAIAQIQCLEVENITDIVNAEERVTTFYDDQPGNINHDCDPYEVLIKSVTQAGSWLEKNETLLAPYASLAKDLNDQVNLLELQRKNVLNLEAQLDGLLGAISFNQTEQELIQDLDLMDLPNDPVDANYTEIYQAVEVISERRRALSLLTKHSDMIAVQQVRHLTAEKQMKASKLLLPCLKKFLSVQYRVSGEKGGSFSISAEDVRMNTAEVITSPVFSEFFKGARCLSMCGDNSFTELINHYVSVSANWIQSVVRFVMGERKVSVQKPLLDDYATTLLESLLYGTLSEGFRAFRLFSRILESSSEHINDITLSSIMRRQLPDVTFFEEKIRHVINHKSVLQNCLLLHFSYSIDSFVAKLNICTDQELQDIVDRVENQIGLDPIPPASAVPFSFSTSWFDASRSQASLGGQPLSSTCGSLSRPKSVTRQSQVVREYLDTFSSECRTLSTKCHEIIEKHVTTVISLMAAPRDISEKVGRASFFSRVKESVDLCHELVSPIFQGPSNDLDVGIKTKSLCEKLIAAAMRSTEVASASGPKNYGDIVKLQCYGYIAARLADSNEEFLIQLSHLSNRVRRHVVRKWAETHIFDVVLSGLDLETIKRSLTVRQMKLRECVSTMKATEVAVAMKKIVSAGLESAAETCAILALNEELVNRTKEKMEELLRHTRKDKTISDLRPRLLAFSRELLALLRVELRQSQSCHSRPPMQIP